MPPLLTIIGTLVLAAPVMCVVGILLLVRLESAMGWRRCVVGYFAQCQGCGYSMEGLSREPRCPECGMGRAEAPPVVMPRAWIAWLGVLALTLPVALAWTNWFLTDEPFMDAVAMMLLSFLMASLVLWCYWPCGARMRWSMLAAAHGGLAASAGVVMWLGILILPDGGSFGVVGGMAVGAAVGWLLVPALLAPGILAGMYLNRSLEPRRPAFS